MSDLIENLPGLPNSDWRRLFKDRVTGARMLRDMWQHQVGEAPKIVEERGQTWGALAWAQHDDKGRPTGKWFLAIAGSALRGSEWIFAGPVDAIPRVDTRRIRLMHSGKEIYLDRLVRDMFEALHHLEEDVSQNRLRLRGPAANGGRSSDYVVNCVIQVLRSVHPSELKAQQPD